MSENSIRLTQYSHGAGCGCKISPKVLETILHSEQAKFVDPNLLVGNETRDDAAVYDLGRQQAGMAAAWLKGHGVVPDKVVSSSLGRAMDTAQLVACELLGPDAAAEPCEGIIERCYGTFEEGPPTRTHRP